MVPSKVPEQYRTVQNSAEQYVKQVLRAWF